MEPNPPKGVLKQPNYFISPPKRVSINLSTRDKKCLPGTPIAALSSSGLRTPLKKPLDELTEQIFKKNSLFNRQKVLRQLGKDAQQRQQHSRQEKQAIRAAKQYPGHSIKQANEYIQQEDPEEEGNSFVNFEERYGEYLRDRNRVGKEGWAEVPHVMLAEYSYEEKEEVGEEQIDAICDVFWYCGKDHNQDCLVRSDVQSLVEQFQRLYFVKVVQEDRLHNEHHLYALLEEFQQWLGGVFFRQDANDLYDVIYHLKDARRLTGVCQVFTQIRQIIE